MDTQLKKGVLELLVFARLNTDDTYGYDIYQYINKNLKISESTIYPILRKMVKEDYLTTYLETSPDGPPRKYFSLTLNGNKRYRYLLIKWHEFVHSVDSLL